MAMHGIDVSQWQGEIVWIHVGTEMSFAIPREGYRKTIDPWFLRYVNGAQSAGVAVPAVYHFLYTISEAEAIAEARSCVENVKQAGLPESTVIFADFEYDSVDKAAARGVNVGKDLCTRMTLAFCREVERLGFRAGVYTNQDFWNRMYDMTQLMPYVIWLAHYNGGAAPAHECKYHQYSSTGSVPGIVGNVDLDLLYGDIAAPDVPAPPAEKILRKEVAAQLMEHLVEHEWHGYSQYARWGDGEGYCYVSVGGKSFALEQGDRDCSSAVINCYQAAGIPVKDKGATYTGNMKHAFLSTGAFKWHPMVNGRCADGYTPDRGDILLNIQNHTAMMQNQIRVMEFSISETGGIHGATGDQTGQESHSRAYYDYPWDGCFECTDATYIDGSRAEDRGIYTGLAKGATGEDVRKMQAMLVAIGYPIAIDGSFGDYTEGALRAFQEQAGVTVDGIYGKETMAVLTAAYKDAGTTIAGVPEIEYAVKTLNHGIRPAVKNGDAAGCENDTIVGIAIKAIGSGSVKYRVHTIRNGWLPWVTGYNWMDENNGYAGLDNLAIDALQVMYYTDVLKTGDRYYEAVYAVKPYYGSTYLPEVHDTDMSNTDAGGTAGIFGLLFTELQLRLERC